MTAVGMGIPMGFPMGDGYGMAMGTVINPMTWVNGDHMGIFE